MLKRLLVGACLGVCVWAPSAFAAPAATDQVLVRFDEGTPRADMRSAARSIGAVTGEDLVAGWRAYRTKSDLTQAQVDAALAGHDVDAQIDLPVVRIAARASDPLRADQFNLDQVDLDAMPSPGQPVTVAVLDSTVKVDHPDLQGSLWSNPGEVPGNGIDDDGNGMVDDVHGWNFLTNSGALSGGANDEHGTHVAGIIAAGVSNGRGITGVAPNARIMAVPFIQGDLGTQANAIRAFQYAITNGARIINASWTAPLGAGIGPLCAAVAEAARNRVLVVAAAGNETVNLNLSPLAPISCPGANVIGVGASAAGSSGIASFSNYGTADVDLLAPGETVYSLGTSGDYRFMSGTSMAAPHVSGAAALFLGWLPDLGPARLATSIIWHGLPNGAPAGRTRSGGRLHLPTALQNLNQGTIGDTTAPSPFTIKSMQNALDLRPTFTWGESADYESGLVEYRLHVDGAQILSVEGSITSATAATDIPYGDHTWYVEAVDAAGNITRSNTGPFTNIDVLSAFELNIPEYVHSTRWTVQWRTSNPGRIQSYELRANGVLFDNPPVTFGNGYFPCEASPICEAQTRLSPTTIELVARTSSGQSAARAATVKLIAAPKPALADIITTDPRPTLRWEVDGEARAITDFTLAIAGSQIPLASGARSHQVPTELALGTHTATLQATMQDGTVTSTSAHVTVRHAESPITDPPPDPQPSPAPQPDPGYQPPPAPAPQPSPAPRPGPSPTPKPSPSPTPKDPDTVAPQAPARIAAPRHGGRYLLRTTRAVVHLNAPAGATRMAVTLTAPKAKDWKRTAKRATIRLKARKSTQIIRVAFRSADGKITRTRIKVLVDRTRPTLRLTRTALGVKLIGHDAGSGVGQYRVRAGKRTGKWLRFRNRQLLPAGSTQVRVRDRAGNLSPWMRIP